MSQPEKIVAIEVRESVIPVNEGLDDPFKQMNGTFKAGFFSGVLCTSIISVLTVIILH